MRKLWLTLFLFMTILPVYGQGSLTGEEIERVRAFKQILDGVDNKSMEQTIQELEKSPYPEINLQIKEALAHTYADLVSAYGVTGHKKQWLYSMVCLNMAYMQFGGDANGTDLNRLIRRKLKEYLPPDVFQQRGFFYSV